MVLHPEVYTKLQNEVDRVVGKDRLPSLEDRPDLTYVDCVLKETYRWNPPLPLGLPHYITEDDTYEGYHLPKDTTVLANLSICREKDMWPGDELDVFRPERFLDLDAEEAKAMDPRQVVFGYGRRLCPGRLFADETLFLVISNMAATLDIRKARDVGGREITPQVSFHPALVRQVASVSE
ncbi:hypothetical protein EVJ58_g996 [Rhodofomes roseus]|uniref:Cytochrome P450 n=1 Tax=Rhodofomes roseus TaxID=34475 RepID=A0A4Y9Z1Q9_9APHY|nr:hypothetical protein EVJ58_g996 [Rhodofomes roseus]